MRGAVKYLLTALLITLLPASGLDAARIKVKAKGVVPKKVQAKRAQRRLNQKAKLKQKNIANAAAARRAKAKVKAPTAPETPVAKPNPTPASGKSSSWTVADGTAKVRGADGTLREVAPIQVNGKNAAFVPEGRRVGSTWTTKDGVTKQKLTDGSVMEIEANGTRTRVFQNGRRITVLPDGTAVSTNALGQQFVRTPDGKLVPVGKKVKPKLPADPPATPPTATPPAGHKIKTRHVVAGAVGAGLLLWPTELGDGTMHADIGDNGNVVLRPPTDQDQDQDQDRHHDHVPGLEDESPNPVRVPRHDQDQDRNHDQDAVPGLGEGYEQEVPGFGDDLIHTNPGTRIQRHHHDQDQDQDRHKDPK